jgi:hypothetical protein
MEMVNHDHAGLALKPPGSFPLCPEEALESESVRDLEQIVQGTVDAIAQYPVVGLILTGSVARGEGTMVLDRGGISRWLSDIEFQVVLDGDQSVHLNEVDATLNSLQRAINIDPLNFRRGIKVSFTSILADQIARLRPSIFAREMLEHGKLVWGQPERVQVPIWWREGRKEIPYLDAFRLLSNRIIQQVDARFRWQYSDESATQAPYTLSKFWIELVTSLSVFIGCYRTSYRERQRAVEDYFKSNADVLGNATQLLIDRLRQAMLVKFGRTTALPCSEKEFRDSAYVAGLVWELEVHRMLGDSRVSINADEPSKIVTALKRLEPHAQRARDWARLLRRGNTRAEFRTDLSSALRAGSLANAIYASGCLLYFFWDEFASDADLGLRLRRTARKLLLSPTPQNQADERLMLSRATVAAWERHLHFAPR